MSVEESVSKHVRWALVPLTILAWFVLAVPALAQGTESGGTDLLLLSTALAWLVPIGLGMLACGTVPPERVPAVMRVGWLALGLSVVGYWLCGFAFQFGGLGFATDHPELAGLAREWTLGGLDPAWGSQWGLIGLVGYLLSGPAATPAALRLFWSQLPWITTAVAVYLWCVQGRVWPIRGAQQPVASGLGVLLVLGGLLQAALDTLVGNWAWGGGWLANLGLNLGLGHGLVDVGGSLVHLLAAAGALAAMVALPARVPRAGGSRPAVRQLTLPTLAAPEAGPDVRWTVQDEPYVPMPALHLPVLATAGAWLALLGWVGWSSSTPLHASCCQGGTLPPWQQAAIGLLLAAAGGALCALLSSWLTTGQGNALMTARGVIGALVAASAGLPFFPLWAALAVGAGAGLLVPLVQYAVDHLLRLQDDTSAVAVHGVSALWGLLAVGLFASGLAGAGWNGVGEAVYLDVEGQGVSGLLVAPGQVSDWPGQFQAQALGAAAVAASALLVSGLLMGAARGLVRTWHGEAAPLQRARPTRARRSRGETRAHAPRRAWHWPQIGHLVPAWLGRRKPKSPESVGDEYAESTGAPPPALEPFEETAEAGVDEGAAPADPVAPAAAVEPADEDEH